MGMSISSAKLWEDVWFNSGLVVCLRVGKVRYLAWAVQLLYANLRETDQSFLA